MPKEPNRKIRKSCAILGLEPEALTRRAIIQAWKNQMVAGSSVDPELADDREIAVVLSSAKDALLDWLGDDDPDSQAPVSGGPTPPPSSEAVSEPLDDQAV